MCIAMAKLPSEKHKRIQYWLKKDDSLSNMQLRELTGASDELISRVRKELGIVQILPCTHAEIDQAFKAFLQKRGKKTCPRENFNPSTTPQKER